MRCPFVSSSASSRVENCYSFTVRLMMSRWQEISRLPSRNTNARLQRVVPTTTPTDGRARSKQAPFVPANQIHSNCSSLEKALFTTCASHLLRSRRRRRPWLNNHGRFSQQLIRAGQARETTLYYVQQAAGELPGSEYIYIVI